MEFLKKKRVIGLIFILSLIIYTIWDNNRLTIAEQEIMIENLSEDLVGFTILQVTDLHEKEFGPDQKRLINLINNLDYDAIVFTGDMLNDLDSKNYKPFYSLIDGIENKENALFVAGNTDPDNYVINSDGTIIKHDFIKGMENRGVEFLESVHTIKKYNTSINFVDFELSVMKKGTRMDYQGRVRPKYALQSKYLTYQNERFEELSILNNKDDDLLIALTHYPVVDKRIDYLNHHPKHIYRDYDLIMAGHYHGGQIRLPLFGAIFVPEPWNERGGLFPPKDRVNGLWEYKGTKQYVSTGLGSSDAFPLMNFRLFNPPEVNVITLNRGHND